MLCDAFFMLLSCDQRKLGLDLRFEIWLEPSRQIKTPGVRNPQEPKTEQSDHMRCLGTETTEFCIAPAV